MEEGGGWAVRRGKGREREGSDGLGLGLEGLLVGGLLASRSVLLSSSW